MRPNPLKKQLADGKFAFGTMAQEFFTPGLPQIVKASGAEFLIFDMEHSGASIETLKNQIALCRGLDLVPLVRPPASEYHFIARVLDVGAMGVEMPMVETREQAEAIVSYTRYPPVGRRGCVFGATAHDDYLGGHPPTLMAQANERTMVICIIETEIGLENVDAIASVPGVDVLWLGHNDLTNFLGIPGDFTHPLYLDAVKKILAACARHGKTAATSPRDEAWAREYMRMGFRMFCHSSDAFVLRSAYTTAFQKLRAAASEID